MCKWLEIKKNEIIRNLSLLLCNWAVILSSSFIWYALVPHIIILLLFLFSNKRLDAISINEWSRPICSQYQVQKINLLNAVMVIILYYYVCIWPQEFVKNRSIILNLKVHRCLHMVFPEDFEDESSKKDSSSCNYTLFLPSPRGHRVI